MSDESIVRNYTVKFEVVKARAKRLISDNAFGRLNDRSAEAFGCLIRLAVSPLFSQRPALAKFAEHFAITGDMNLLEGTDEAADSLSALSRAVAEQAFTDASRELALVIFQARQEAMHVIDRWDVRAAPMLLSVFPQTIPRSCHGAAIKCTQDTLDSSWTISFGDSPKPTLRPGHLFQPIFA